MSWFGIMNNIIFCVKLKSFMITLMQCTGQPKLGWTSEKNIWIKYMTYGFVFNLILDGFILCYNSCITYPSSRRLLNTSWDLNWHYRTHIVIIWGGNTTLNWLRLGQYDRMDLFLSVQWAFELSTKKHLCFFLLYIHICTNFFCVKHKHVPNKIIQIKLSD